jgi:hypothetical protein
MVHVLLYGEDGQADATAFVSSSETSDHLTSKRMGSIFGYEPRHVAS